MPVGAPSAAEVQAICDAFNYFDADRNGVLSPSEFKRILQLPTKPAAASTSGGGGAAAAAAALMLTDKQAERVLKKVDSSSSLPPPLCLLPSVCPQLTLDSARWIPTVTVSSISMNSWSG